jgi:hypothetical protein
MRDKCISFPANPSAEYQAAEKQAREYSAAHGVDLRVKNWKGEHEEMLVLAPIELLYLFAKYARDVTWPKEPK